MTTVSDAALQKIRKRINATRPAAIIYDVQLIDDITDEMRERAKLDKRLHPFDRTYYLIEGEENGDY